MRAAILTVALLVTPRAFSQTPEASTTEPPSPATESAGSTAHPKQKILQRQMGGGDPHMEMEQMRMRARVFFSNLLLADARALVAFSAVPFMLESRTINGPEELMREWLTQLRAKRTDLLTLYDIEVYTGAEMEKKYGKPPARLAQFPLHNGTTYVAVANISGHAAVAVFRNVGYNWRVVAYHD